jgi:hypothetical protein
MRNGTSVVKKVVGLAVLVSAVLVLSQAPVVGAAELGASWDQFEQCKINCNESYGGLDVFPPGLRRGGTLGWSNCVLACERKYWKQFDKDTDDSK